MSTTSCPRCSAQVTLPVGVSNDTTVRCPLCHAHYTLADALVNMPPLLEVVEDAGDALPADWYAAPKSDSAGQSLAAAALPEEEASEADTLEMGSLELEGLELDAAEDFDGDSEGKETVVDNLSKSPWESAPVRQDPVAEDDDALLDFDAPEATPVDDDELTAGELPGDGEDDLSLDFGGDALTTEEAEAVTLEFTPGMVESFGEKSDDEVKFDLESEDEPADEAATIEFGAPIGDEDSLFGSEDDEVKFDFDETSDQAETVQFTSPATVTSDDEVEFNFDAPEAESSDEGLRGFEDIHVDASGEAEDIPLDLPVAAVTAVPVLPAEAAGGKKGKKEKKTKEKKVKAVNPGDKPRRSLVGMLAGLLLAIPAAIYGALWLGPDYDFLSMGKFLPSAMLPAEFKKKPTQVAFVPPVAQSIPDTAPPAEEAPAEEMPSEEPAAADDAAAPSDAAATEHSAARPVDEPAASPAEDAPADAAPAPEMPSEDPAVESPTLTPPSEAAATPAADAATPEADPFAPAETPAATPEADDPFGPAKTDEAPTAEMPADDKPAAADDLFAPETAPAANEAASTPALAAPSESEKPAEPPAPAEDDPFAPAPQEKPADAPASADPFAPAAEPATPPAATRPTEEDPFGPAPTEPAAETPTTDPAAPADMPAEEAIPAPTPEVMPETRPADADPFSPAPADKPAAEALPSPVAPADEPAAIAPALPVEKTAPADPAGPADLAEALGPRNVPEVSPAALQGAVQTTFVSGQQLMAAEATGDEAQLRKARAAFYVNLFGMADAITSAQLGGGGAAVDQQLQSLGPVLRQQLATDPKRLEALKVFGARWIGFPKRTTNGVVVSGTVESAEQVGKLFHTKARLGSAANAPLVTIVTAAKPDVASGDVVLALGSIVDDPQQKLSGYEGSEPAVVWSGMTMKVAP